MKKLNYLLIIILLTAFSNLTSQAQTCTSPVLLDGLNGAFTPTDSFNLQNRFFKFTANNPSHKIKAYIKKLSKLGGNIVVNLYANNCASLTASQLTVTPTTIGDTIVINYSGFSQGVEYLVEINKIVNNSSYVVYNLNINNGATNVTWGCFGMGPCIANLPCEYICNGSFENITTTPTWFQQLNNAYNWGDANGGTSDLISTLALPTSDVAAGCNYAGNQSPFNGVCATKNNYSSSFIETNYTLNTNACEYIQTQLTSTLQAGKTYIISFQISKGDHSNGNLNSLGVWLTPNQINSPGQAPITTPAPSIILTNTLLLNNTNVWQNITLCYYSVSGGENYLTIGRPNGSLVSLTSAPSSPCSIYSAAQANTAIYYMYIDEVSLKPFDVLATSSTSSVDVCGNVNLNVTFPCSTGSLNPLNYSWTGPNNLNNALIQNPVATINSTSNYNVQVTGYDSNIQQCIANSTISIISNTLNPLSLSSSAATVCPNSPVTISCSLTGGTNSYTYMPGNQVGNNISFSPSVTTTYTISGTGANGCIQTKLITIYTYTSNVSASASPNSICNGFSSTLTASNGSSFSWQPGSLAGSPVIVSPTVTTTYTLSGTSVNGCFRTNTITVTVNNPSAISISPSSTNSICLNSSINLIASGASTYTWNPGNFIGANNNVTPLINTTYTVLGTNSFGCIGSKTVAVFINSLPIVNCSTSNTTACPGLSSTLSASGANTYTWLPSTFSPSTVVSPTITTSYTVIGTSAIGCTNSCVLTQSVFPTTTNFFTVTATPSIVCNQPPYNLPTTITVVGTSNYTLSPPTTINAPITTTLAGTYSASATSTNGCVYTKTTNVSYTDEFASIQSATICNTGTINLSTLITQTNTAGGTYSINGTGSSSTFGPAAAGIYTVTYTYTAGILCINTATATINVITSPATPTITASASTICAGYNLTLTASPASPNYTWQPGNIVGSTIVVTPTTTTNYLVVNNNGYCPVFGSFPVTVIPTPTVTAIIDGNSYLCSNQVGVNSGTLHSFGAITYTWLPTISTGSTLVVSPSSTTNYTVIGTAANGCTASAITVFSIVPTPTINVTNSSTVSCGASSYTLNATGASLYNWQPGNLTGNTAIVNPTATTIYSVTGSDANSYCYSNTFTIQLSNFPCACSSACTNPLSGNINVSPAANTVYCISSAITINGVVTFSNSDFKITPNATITVPANSTLNIIGSHLYSCDNMWQGIIVLEGGKLNITYSSTRTSLIEDAFVGVDIPATTPTYTATNILNVDNVTFNRNQTGIKIADYVTSQSTYPMIIQNSLFTSRSIAFTALSHPATNTVKLSLSGNTSSLQTPYISNTTYPPAGLKSPFLAGYYPDNGIVLNEVGYTVPNGNNWFGIVIGNLNTANGFNCFDNLRQDITANNTNIQLSNNVFQNGVRYGRGSSSGGKAIVAISANVTNDVKGARNNQIKLISVGTNTALNNRFYEKVACADVNGYINIEIKNAQAYTFANNYNLFNNLNAIGDRGFNIVTNRYFNIIMDNNRIYNIKNSMLVGIDNSGFWFASGTGNYGRMVGNILVTNNIVNRHPGTPTSAEFVNIGFSLSDPFSSATTNIAAPGSSSNLIQNNKFTNVHNGIAVSNVAFSGVTIVTNTITMVNEPNTYNATPIQTGINAVQLNNSNVNQNNISGVTSYSPGVKAISTQANALLAISCNTTANSARGLEFNGIQTISTLEDNTMDNQTYGLVLDNNAKLTSTLSTFVMGSASRPTNNVWLNSWTVPKYKTGTFNSSAQNGKLYVTYGNANLDPDGSGNTNLFFFTDNYWHTGTGTVTLLNSSAVSPSCRISSGGGGGTGRMAGSGNDSNIVALLEQTTNDSIIFNEASTDAEFINQNTVYRTLKANSNLQSVSSTLNNFFTNSQNSSVKKLYDLENDIVNANHSNAISKLNAFTPSNNVETNYKNYYGIYLKTKDSTYSSSDSLDLANLASSCPYTSGSVVHQARSLYNILYNTYKVFYDNCGDLASRKINKDRNDIQVMLKTQLYPNPNNGNYTVRFDKILEKQNVEISIFDMTGKLILRESKFISGNEINMSNILLNGAYTLKVKLPDGTYDLHKIIINK